MSAFAQARAPGKLMLCGEYAVTDGAPAIACAVDRYALARSQPSRDEFWHLSAAGYAAAPARFRIRAGLPEWQTESGAADYRLVQALLNNEVFGALMRNLPCQRLHLDTREFADGARKLGIGSSAALCVALCTLLCELSGEAVDIVDVVAVHRELQGGQGSGADVAVSSGGGVRRIQREQGRLSDIELLWPRGLHWAVVDTGRPASTAVMLGRLQRWRASDVADLSVWQRLQDGAINAAAAWERADAADVLLAVSDYAVLEQALDETAEIGIFQGGHRELEQLGRAEGVVYKPSGAGGGDLGIALSLQTERLQSFVRRAAASGFRPCVLNRSEHGVHTQ